MSMRKTIASVPVQATAGSARTPGVRVPGARAAGAGTPGVESRVREARAAPAADGAVDRLERARRLGHRPEHIQRALYRDTNANQYETETFAVNRERPKKVSGTVHSTRTAGRGGAPPALSLWNPTAGENDRQLGWDGGHVLGLELGGEDARYNVVPMLPKFNRDTWRKVEQELLAIAIFSYSGRNFRYRIDLAYANTTAKAPTSLTARGFADVPITKKVRGKTVQTGRVDVGKKVFDETKSQPGDIEVTAMPGQAESERLLGTKPKRKEALKELQKRPDFSTDAFLQAIARDKHLPTSRAQDYPDKPADRPYEYLDIQVLANVTFSDANFGPRKEFSGGQRELILKYNLAKHGGQLVSDDPVADPHPYLDERGAADFPEVDHIIPKSQGGSNFFSNARLVSWQLNNKEDRVKDITPYIALERISVPALTGREEPEQLVTKGILILKKWIGRGRLATFKEIDAQVEMAIQTLLRDQQRKALVTDALSQMVTDGFLTVSSKTYTVV